MSEVIQISLAAARVNAKLTKEEVANKMKVGKRTIINWEKGTATPSFADVNMLSNISGIVTIESRSFYKNHYSCPSVLKK